MSKCYFYVAAFLSNYRVFELHFSHRLKCRVQTFANIFIWRIWELIDQTNNCRVTCETRIQNVLYRHVPGKRSGTQDLDALIEDLDMHVVGYAVVTMQDGIGNNLMNSSLGIRDAASPFAVLILTDSIILAVSCTASWI